MAVDYKTLFSITKQNIFDDIFNYTAITLKNNVKLTILNNGKAVRSMLYNSIISMLMPDTTTSFYVFMCSNVAISNLLFEAKGWVNLEDILNQFEVNADFVTIDNKMIPKRMIYGIIDHSGNTAIAIDIRAYKKLNATTETYMVINVDTDNVGDRTVVSHIPTIHENMVNVLAAINQHQEHQRIGFINGYVYRNDIFAVSNINTNDYYELYIDANVKFKFVVDLSNRNTYMDSDKDRYNDIVIIPSSLAEDKVFTYDTVTLLVMTDDGKGVYLPFIADDSITQLTHTSFGVASYLIDAAFDKLGVTTGELHVIVSDYSKTNVNVPNGSITEQLYQIDDANIMRMMLGTATPKVPYWTADALDKHVYSKYLVNIDELDEYSTELINKQIACLGYYQFTNLICRHNNELKDLGSEIAAVSIPVPVFWKGTELYPILYIDGNKIPYSRYSCVTINNNIQVTFAVPYPVDTPTSILQYELMQKPVAKSYVYIASQSNQTVVIPDHGTIHIFHKVTEQLSDIADNKYQSYEELSVSSNKWYSLNKIDNNYVITFTDYAMSNEFLFTFDETVTINSYPNIDITDGHTLCFLPKEEIVDSTDHVNVVTAGIYDVYLNGKYLVNGIDYCIKKLVDDDIVAGYAVVVQNLKFLSEAGVNTIDIYKTGNVIIDTDINYIVDGIITKNTDNEAWIPGISRLFINGKLVPYQYVTKHTTHYEIDSKYYHNGDIYQFINSVSKDFHDAYKAYMDAEYFVGRKDVCTYFTHDYHHVNQTPIVITNVNKIFSSYLNEIIRRIIAGEIEVVYINDDVDIINQLRDYEGLKQYDVLFQGSLINKQFVDVYPGYIATVKVSDLNKYLYIQRLVKIILGVDAVTDHMVVYTGI